VSGRFWILLGCITAALGVVLGAFAAHALEASLIARGTLASWETAVRYQLVHALALVLFGLFRDRSRGKDLPGWCFLFGSLFFSGSLYVLCFGVLQGVMGPLTPIGGTLLLIGWISFALEAAHR
jgi:uncharacterized membrane protein YgdD (TMEM256/DUF423 family)